MRRLFTSCVLAMSLFPTLASAQSVCRIVSSSGAPGAIVAQPGKLKEFIALFQAGEKVAAAQVMACMPSLGDKVLITDRGFASHTIRVLSGQSQGCVGDVVVESVGSCQ